ncbi:MAG: TonB-dependent receptor [Alphaproteobacteria bacterium]|nr:TonB-dependent receptor [Alphaproteobacteria bacterium]MBU1527296.1 TonB-dependent receptor [Alphaproteobacteria bacterium]MBU2118142.1 TonB-dependent receptor [Alphaproteobacteria bacterium]MBU2349961.1 TonB-dependent receptor [Alphaproteobacteria bacterium]MBU2382210.1 TonB-dependent receptor [Alphaproteobacteria bacterium]
MKSVRNHLLASSVLAGVMTAAAPVWAQTPPQDQTSTGSSSQDPLGPQTQDVTQVDEIVVTGSRIRRDATNAPTPLIQVQREDLLSTGQTTVIDYLATIPALSNSVVPSDTTGSGLGDGGLSLPNLRSLGSNRTLTLVDGRRHVGSSGGSLSVDVDTIPRLLIENIEIVTGGASSVYGADAVSGVLNFILRKDFEGLEIDANYGMINQDGEANKRISVLAGRNFMDGRLNVYAHGEYEEVDEVTSLDIDWLRDARVRIGTDADPTNARFDGVTDAELFTGVRRIDLPRWGQTTLANVARPSPLNDPDVPYEDCFSGTDAAFGFSYSPNCFGVQPGLTYWYEGNTARLADFGTRVGETGINRPYVIGGDGENPAEFSTGSRVPRSESARFQTGATFEITSNIEAYAEAKYVTEDTFDLSQPTFYDIDLVDSYSATRANPVYNVANFDLRWSDNAFLPQNVKDAIATNFVTPYAPPTADAPGTPLAPILLQNARHSLFGPDRTQDNTRELTRFVVGVRGSLDQVGFLSGVDWDIGYTYGEVEVENRERGTDSQRFALAADAVIDSAGVVNGTPGEIVCRVQLLDAQGVAAGRLSQGPAAPGDLRDSEYGRRAIDECVPLNVFGKGNQSAEALAYIDAVVGVTERNEQEQAIASVSGSLWDIWGAGPIGVALGAEYRREATSATGRDRDTAGRPLLFLNTGPDFPEVEYTSEEVFAEVSVPLFADSWLGDYAELSGSYRYADYSTVGDIDVYGVNLVYRPISDIAFKTSYNTSVRVPDLGENFAPFSQTFLNDFTDPCATLVIAAQDEETRANRIANCTALAQSQGLSFDFAGATATNADDFTPDYTSGIAGVLGGNPNLEPEESTSFTFSTVLRPRFFPNFSLVLDYYEIEIDRVIASVSAGTAAANCVSGPSLNTAACATIFRNNPDIPFGVGAPVNDPVGGFIEGSINYASLKTRGLDFTANYSMDLEETFGRPWGNLRYSLGGLWLIDQQQFLNADDPADFDELASTLFYPRVRFTSSLTYEPNDVWSVNWTADWQSAQDIVQVRDFVANADSRPTDQLDTRNFARHDFTVRWNAREDLSVRAGVVNAFDAEQAPYLGTTLYSNFDPYGRRFFIGLNYKL